MAQLRYVLLNSWDFFAKGARFIGYFEDTWHLTKLFSAKSRIVDRTTALAISITSESNSALVLSRFLPLQVAEA